jgi:hypothetical protein
VFTAYERFNQNHNLTALSLIYLIRHQNPLIVFSIPETVVRKWARNGKNQGLNLAQHARTVRFGILCKIGSRISEIYR